MTRENGMFYGASPEIFKKAKELRSNLTEAERLLWERLKKNQMLGYRFKPQHPIDVYIVDFYCHKLKLVIEVDGGVHLENSQAQYDRGRTHVLNELGITVVRFSNEKVMASIEDVMKEIDLKCKQIGDVARVKPLHGI